MLTKERIPQLSIKEGLQDILQEGYLFIKSNAEQYNTDLFEVVFMGQKIVCMLGEEATKLFYNPDLFKRGGAMPKRVQKSLFGEGAIQSMDGNGHLHRKQLFMSIMTPSHQQILSDLFNQNLESYLAKWEQADEIVLVNEAKEILCKTACRWAGIPLPDIHVQELSEVLSDMVDAFGAFGPRHWRGRTARNKTEEWASTLIEDVRSNKINPEIGSPLFEIAFYTDHNNVPLSNHMAAIEILNVIRPIVAISTYITFMALALLEHPNLKEDLIDGTEEDLEMFVNEVRRFYPFAPFLGAKVRKDFTWNNYEFTRDTLVLLDIYGTNHDSRIWENPDQFKPERFNNWDGSLYNFIPQGGGDPSTGHRCSGEGITIALMKACLNFLVNKIDYDVPEQDLSYSLTKMPTLPKSGFIMTNIRRKS